MSADESVFPHEKVKSYGLTDLVKIVPGLTKRELFAALAMQGLLSAVYSSKEMLNEFTIDGSGAYKKHVTGNKAISENAVSYADALMAQLAKKDEVEGG